ncbi:hypothetical protein [Nocardia neocaledoniensis]|nr:hypothetical protein [Nocardia neocaledoniensis]
MTATPPIGPAACHHDRSERRAVDALLAAYRRTRDEEPDVRARGEHR